MATPTFYSVWLEYHCAYFHFQSLYVFASGVSFLWREKKQILLLISTASVCLEKFRQPCFLFFGECAPTVLTSSLLEICWSAELILFLPFLHLICISVPQWNSLRPELPSLCLSFLPPSPVHPSRVSPAPLASWAWIALVLIGEGLDLSFHFRK